MCTKVGDNMIEDFEDFNDDVKLENGAKMTSCLSDQIEKVIKDVKGNKQTKERIESMYKEVITVKAIFMEQVRTT